MYVANFAMIELMVVDLFLLTVWAWGPNYSERKKHAQCTNRAVSIGTASANSSEFRGIRPRLHTKDLL